MGKYSGLIGFSYTETNEYSVVTETIVEKKCFGEILRTSLKTKNDSNVNQGITMSNRISIVANPFINQNIYAIRYVTFLNVKWKVTTVDVDYPNIILTLGDVYNE